MLVNFDDFRAFPSREINLIIWLVLVERHIVCSLTLRGTSMQKL